MVGVTGKSLACNTCRQRRVKCGLERPSCQRCLKAQLKCTGYERERIFVNRTPSKPSTTATAVLGEIRARQRSKEAELRNLYLKSALNYHKFRKHAVALLRETYLPRQSSPSASAPSEGSFAWADRLVHLVEPSQSLDTALFAFCLAQLQVIGADNITSCECLDRYDIALKHLRSDLDDLTRRPREETLAAILLLSTFELFVCPESNAWGFHARGIVEILRLRDPEPAITPAWQHMFSRIRIVCTLEALTKRSGQILDSDVWRQIDSQPGSIHSALDHVYQMVAGVPALLERAVSLSQIDAQSTLMDESSVVAKSLVDMAKSLSLWHDEFCEASPTSQYWLVPSRSRNPADYGHAEKLFPSRFEFRSLDAAVPIVMFWAVAAQLYSHVIQICDLVQSRLGSHISFDDLLQQRDVAATSSELRPATSIVDDMQRPISMRGEGERMALSVCQSLEYFHQAEMGTYGSHATTYPCWSARQYFRLHPGYGRELEWVKNVHQMEGDGMRWGVSTMTFADIVEPLRGSS